MANGQLLARVTNSPALDRIARAGRAVDRLREVVASRDQRELTTDEVNATLARAIAEDEGLVSDLNLEDSSKSRVVRGTQVSLNAFLLALAAGLFAWKTGDWGNVLVQASIVLPALVAVGGNALALFGRLSSNPGTNFNILNPRSWFRTES